ncbi:Resolvase domain protein [Candidatus Jidaibacter acanthamoeba]|uniref:Resolvase domain protein n=1 Tax=Candidatus Jidaibacter acanthamoebae TaxID=86105 RepID=A0A0C1QL37_9RICK|nr:recombinase family protein [Candidatus Jidaibacter acanthamoeba]KIE06214.1 Resolvase domain protein [Candidatus Jidaibacter acanthamoeba]
MVKLTVPATLLNNRSLPHLLSIMNNLHEKGIAFRSITEQMDTTTLHGELLFQLFGSLARYERALTGERVIAGLESAKRRGRIGGRPRVIDEEKMEAILDDLKSGVSKASICRTFGIKPSTLYDALNRNDYSL